MKRTKTFEGRICEEYFEHCPDEGHIYVIDRPRALSFFSDESPTSFVHGVLESPRLAQVRYRVTVTVEVE